MKKKSNFVTVVLTCFREGFRYGGFPLFMTLVFHLVTTSMDAVMPYLNDRLYNAVGEVIGGASWTHALWPLLVMGLDLMVVKFLYEYSWFNKSKVNFRLKDGMLIPVNKACATLEPIAFEDPAELDRIGKAVSGATGACDFINCVSFIFFYTLPYILIQTLYFWSLRPVLALSALIIFIPSVLTQVLRLVMFRKLEDTVAPMRRENDYFDRTVSHREFFKETRLLGAYRYFAKRFRESLNNFCRASARAEVKSGLYHLGSQAIMLTGYVFVLILLFESVMEGYISVGSFAAVLGALANYVFMIWSFVEDDIGGAVKEYGAVQNYVDFIRGAGEKKPAQKIENRGDITLSDVRFTYPGAEHETIKGITFHIHAGETLAVVGENGAGKSTLMQLVTGQFPVTSGQILAGGVDLSSVNQASRYAGVSAVFQKFGRYRLTAGENITISADPMGEQALAVAAEKGDVALNDTHTFPDGADTMLSREFGGVDLSGGQWQRVAVARGLYRDHDLVILDEPTAAIDPLEETRLYKRFAEIAEGKTAIIVTHRLGSARIADRILVMRDGVIDDVGTHEELIEKGGYYAEMYAKQAEWYQ
ncbi:MAG: ABC transporter ATP-binding protein [Ruminococcaceae bacterium]|nr:ABC transporter ATP-binding protein [Oscillospiraceae bacterium]